MNAHEWRIAPSPRGQYEVLDLATLPRRKGQELRIALSRFRGTGELGWTPVTLGLRMFHPGERGEMIPSVDGVTVHLAEIPDLAGALIGALNWVRCHRSNVERKRFERPAKLAAKLWNEE